jgi:hypothetical protein
VYGRDKQLITKMVKQTNKKTYVKVTIMNGSEREGKNVKLTKAIN